MGEKNILKAVEFIDNHFAEKMTLRNVAAQTGFSPFHLTRLLKKETGYSFIQLLNRKRLSLSKKLLEQMSVTEVCFEAGFESLSYFSRRFKIAYGLNPSEYRARLKDKHKRKLLFPDEDLSQRCLGQKPVSFVEQYHRGILEVIGKIAVRETQGIMEAADLCAAVLKKGKRVVSVSHHSEGYLVESFGWDQREPAPVRRRWYPIHKSYDQKRGHIRVSHPRLRFLPEFEKGDVLVTSIPFQETASLRNGGVEVTGLASPFYKNRSAALKKLEAEETDPYLEDISNRVIYSHVLPEDGLVCVPEIPVTPFAPCSTVALQIIRSTLREWTADRFIGLKPDPDSALTADLTKKMKAVPKLFPLLKKVGVQAADKVIAGGRFYVSGSREIISEFTWRGSGLFGLEPLKPDRLGDKDVVLIHASSPNDQKAVELARRSREKRAYTVVLYPGSKVKKKHDSWAISADDSMDTSLGDYGRAAEDPAERTMARLSAGILPIILGWMVCASFLQEMVIRGHVPFVFRGFHLRGGKKYNEALYPLYLERGY